MDMSTDFDPIKAIKEEISGLSDVHKVISLRVDQAAKAMGEAEIELNALLKLQGFARSEMDRKREVLQKLEREAEKE
jgi:hypothetical protein